MAARGRPARRETEPSPPPAQGKVRDTYDCGDCIVIVTTDRQSAFDRLLAAVPFKGRVLNGTSAWWMTQTKHVAPNALLSTPHPNVAVMRKCTVFPVEFVGACARARPRCSRCRR